MRRSTRIWGRRRRRSSSSSDDERWGKTGMVKPFDVFLGVLTGQFIVHDILEV